MGPFLVITVDTWVQIISQTVSAIAAIVVAFLAIKGFHNWRKEIRLKERIKVADSALELAHELLLAFSQVSVMFERLEMIVNNLENHYSKMHLDAILEESESLFLRLYRYYNADVRVKAVLGEHVVTGLTEFEALADDAREARNQAEVIVYTKLENSAADRSGFDYSKVDGFVKSTEGLKKIRRQIEESLTPYLRGDNHTTPKLPPGSTHDRKTDQSS